MVNDDGYLPHAWQYNNEDPPQKIYPYLVQKRGATERAFDVSITGKSIDYRGMAADEFVEKLVAGEFPESASVRMKPMNKRGSMGNGWLIRNIEIEPRLYELTGRGHRRAVPLRSIDEELERQLKEADGITTDELKRLSNSYPHAPERVEVVTSVFRRNPYVVIEVLRRADGVCEGCGRPAPFKRRSNDSPYLEVHHEVTLAEGGDDTAENALALCPNCHRERHFG